MTLFSISYSQYLTTASIVSKMTGVQITITGVPISAIAELMTAAYVSNITVSDLFENLDFPLLAIYNSVITSMTISPTLQVNAFQLTEYKNLILLNTTPLLLQDSALQIISIYPFIQTNFPLATIAADLPYLVPQPLLTLTSVTDTSLTFDIANITDPTKTYDSYVSQLVCTTTNTICSSVVSGLSPGVSYSFILTITGSKGLILTTSQTVTTHRRLVQQIADLTFEYSAALDLPLLKDDVGASYSLQQVNNGYAYTMTDNAFVGKTKNFSLYDNTTFVCAFNPIVVSPYSVPVPNFHFSNISYQSMTLNFDLLQNSLNDSFTIRVTDDSGVDLYTELNSATSSVNLSGFSAGRTVTITVQAEGTSGGVASITRSQATRSIDSLAVTQNAAILTFSWGGVISNAAVSLNGIVVAEGATPVEYVMPDNSLVGGSPTFHLTGNPTIGDTQYSTNQISLSFPVVTVLPFRVPIPVYRLSYDGSFNVVFATPLSVGDESFTYTVECSNGSVYSNLQADTLSLSIGTPQSFTVSAVGENGQTQTTNARIAAISETLELLPDTRVYIADMPAQIFNFASTISTTQLAQILSKSETTTLKASDAIRLSPFISTPFSVSDTTEAVHASLQQLSTLENLAGITTPSSVTVSAAECAAYKSLSSMFTPYLSVVDTAESIAAYFNELKFVSSILSTNGNVKLSVSDFLANQTTPLNSVEIVDSANVIALNLALLETFSTIKKISSNDLPYDIPVPSFTISDVNGDSATITIAVPASTTVYDKYGFSIFNPITGDVFKMASSAGAIQLENLTVGQTYSVSVKTIGSLGFTRAAPVQTFRTKSVLISNVCFPKNTMVTCDQGTIPIQNLTKENTFYGYPVQAITETITMDDYLVEFAEHSLAPNIPCSTLQMSKDHAIFWQGKLQKARAFKQGKRIAYGGEILYNVLLEVHGLMNVNGMACETLHPSNTVANMYRSAFTQETVQEWNNYALANTVFS